MQEQYPFLSKTYVNRYKLSSLSEQTSPWYQVQYAEYSLHDCKLISVGLHD